MRIGTLVKLRYGHVKEDLEAKRIPLHIHVEAEITKGKYADYDTFINEEAVHYLQLYLDQRRRGTDKIKPEEIKEDSPLFVTSDRNPKALSHRGAVGMLVKALSRAGLREKAIRRHEIRIHSLRKFFRTQMESLGVPRDYCEYMMGHKLSTYHDEGH
jgi:site-specific recombinase XerD